MATLGAANHSQGAMMSKQKAGSFPVYQIAQVANLIPYARNSRTHSEQQISKIAASIKEFGFLNPVIIDGENGIIAGHGRILAAQKLGMETVPVIEAAHLSEAQRRAYVIADNRLALDAEWDDELLRVEFAELEGLGFDLELTGFDLESTQSLGRVAQPLGLTPEEKLENYLDGDTKILRLAYTQEELETVVAMLDKGLLYTGASDYSSLVMNIVIGASSKW